MKEHIEKFYELKADVICMNKEIHIYAEVPGMEIKDINIDFIGRYLIIKGLKRKNFSSLTKLHKYIDNECPYGSFKKYIPVPSNIDMDSVLMKLENGILFISMSFISVGNLSRGFNNILEFEKTSLN